MRNLLTKHGIPDTTLIAAVDFLNVADEATVEGFIREFKLTMNGRDALAAARFAADAIFRGAGAVDKVVGYVAKMMTGFAPKPAARAVPVTMTGGPVVDMSEVVLVPVEPTVREEVAPVIAVKGRRGRKRLGDSDFCKAVSAIEGAPKDIGREGLLNCIVAQGIKQSSAVVYLWRYNKGERE